MKPSGCLLGHAIFWDEFAAALPRRLGLPQRLRRSLPALPVPEGHPEALELFESRGSAAARPGERLSD